MKRNWKTYRLGDFLERQYDSVVIDDFSKYKHITIKTKGQGIELRDEVEGLEIGTKNQFRVKENQLLLSKIDAMNGAFGIVPIECDGGIITGNFWTYKINEKIIQIEYLRLLCIKQVFTRFSIEASEGTTNRKYLREDNFLNLYIPLPPLAEQQRIVAKIESVKSRIEEIKRLRTELERELGNLLYSTYRNAENDFKNVPLKSVLIFSKNQEKPKIGTIYRQMGIRVWGTGGYERESIDGSETKYPFFTKVETDDLVINKIWVRNGALAVVPKELSGCYVSTEFPTFKYDHKVLNPKWIEFLIKQKKFWELCDEKSFGTSGKNRIKSEQFLNVEIPLPPIEEQNHIVAILEKVNSIQQAYKQQEQELTELFSSLLDKAFKGKLFAENRTVGAIAAEPKASYVPNSSIPENKKGFAKQVLGGKIVSLFKDDKHFTNIKFQKLQYLAEHIIEEDLNWNYYRQPAGPYDNKFMHSVFNKLQQNQWFECRNYKFYPLKKADNIEHYYQNYFGNKAEKLSNLFSLLQNASEKFCEAIATIYAVWNNHIIQNLPFDKSRIKTDFFEWSNRKEKQFTEVEFDKALEWMNRKNIVPTGFGQIIKEKK